ncbi:T9SS type A sorting domain-containing protein [Flavobacterium jejuense]|uniref:T9SS type A sorting domain-containing protein n=1 Tax=Flavobacterium jejuense TaxID=1544455 RepID=A0ABX0ILL3_9FLAO|nr:T9SS type A sorting domain-containing protein [Flavobacterium jejuense]NHN24471.1 T9SS type A sorting domain-containing protein [Flavobacterium jejuense]
MKQIYFFVVVFISCSLQAQIINIPDANFKAKLLNASSSNTIASIQSPNAVGNVTTYNSIDTNNNGEIEVSEAALITFINVGSSNSSNSSNIFDLTGIEYFSNLITLSCSFNQLSTLDVTQNQDLENLYCYNNNLSTLDVTYNQNLKLLACSNNPLTSINLTQNINLKKLYCNFNTLTALDVTQNPYLEHLECVSNSLTVLNVTQNPNLQTLNCDVNQLDNINVTQNTNLEFLSCVYNQLTTLNITQNLNLKTLRCYYNLLNTLDVSQNLNISTLFSFNNQLTSLFMKNGNNDMLLNPVNNATIGFDVSNNPNLKYICCDEESILDVQVKMTTQNSQNCVVNSYCSFIPGGVFYNVEGNVKYDFNDDDCDSNDINYSNLNFSITDGINSGSLISNSSGNYSIPVQAGSHTITPNLENPTYFTISPTSLTVDFPTQASPFTQDFCVTANGIHSDVEVVILPTTPARPGFDAKYKIIYRNKGNQIENGAITFMYNNAVLDYVSANPVYDSQATDSFVWNYTNLQPFETREIAVTLNVNSPMETPAVNIGDQLNFLAQITPTINDEVLYDNTSAIKQIVVGSYDPNDKTCLEGEIVSPDMIGEYVHYLIRFENTGTYPAENVVVKDMIDLTKFDIATLIPLKGSHDFYTRIKDNKVEFIFENINLDFNDATNDGYVAFKIKTKPTLVVGDTFSNDANIYFDYNFPITTNTYTTTIQALSSQDFDFVSQFTLYPNPVKDVLHFNSKENLEIQSVEIYNMLGQIVISVPNATTSIDISTLTKENYFVKINTEKGSANTKFIKE